MWSKVRGSQGEKIRFHKTSAATDGCCFTYSRRKGTLHACFWVTTTWYSVGCSATSWISWDDLRTVAGSLLGFYILTGPWTCSGTDWQPVQFIQFRCNMCTSWCSTQPGHSILHQLQVLDHSQREPHIEHITVATWITVANPVQERA